MTSIRKLALALCLAGSFSYSNAQTVDSTGNLINNQNWSGVGAYAPDPNDCCANPAGSAPLYDTATDTIKWSYGQTTVEQGWAVNQALQGTGIQVHGYTYQYDLRNMNSGDINQNGIDTMVVNTWLKDSAGQVILSDSTVHNTQFDWTTFGGTRTLGSPVGTADLGTAGISFASRDGGFWAGLYGPEVRDVSFRLNYSYDPCGADPLYSPTCPGYTEAYKNLMCTNNPLYDPTCPGHDAIVTSSNLVPRAGNNTGWLGGSLNNSFAINQALSHGGAGVMIHGFNWGYRTYNFNLFGMGLGSSTVNVNIRDGDGTSLHAWSRNNTASGDNWYSSSYIFPQSRNNTTLGNFDFTATTSGWGMVDNMWVRAVFTPDSCSLDPLSSVLCTKYEEAFLAQQCGITALFSPQCPGYIEAMNEMLAQSNSIGVTDVVALAPTTETSTTIAGTDDATKNPAEVREDVGGAELTTDGTISVSDGIPSDSKKSAEQSATIEKQESKSTLSRSQLLSLAQRAAREAEKTALSAAEDAVDASLSDDANPADGVGLGDLPGVRILQGLGNANSIAADNQALASSRGRGNTEEMIPSSAETAKEEIHNTLETAVNPLAIEQKEETAKAGPSVRRGGSVDGMEGGADISELARVPMDFNQYLDQQMQDAQFYASKDIYRGQRNVDNARALRGLGTDRLHQEMVNQQYNQGAR